MALSMKIRYLLLGILLSACIPAAQPPDAAPAESEEEFSGVSIYDASRVTKKPFGIHITPQTSPVSPEKFSGYHTGTDFEALGDPTYDLLVTALCNGTVRYAQWVSGYGGVLVQDCTGTDSPVTVLYGHISMDSLFYEVGDAIEEGAELGHLGEGFTEETDGERPHLHLSVYKGTRVELKGYVKSMDELNAWVDPMLLLN